MSCPYISKYELNIDKYMNVFLLWSFDIPIKHVKPQGSHFEFSVWFLRKKFEFCQTLCHQRPSIFPICFSADHFFFSTRPSQEIGSYLRKRNIKMFLLCIICYQCIFDTFQKIKVFRFFSRSANQSKLIKVQLNFLWPMSITIRIE